MNISDDIMFSTPTVSVESDIISNGFYRGGTWCLIRPMTTIAKFRELIPHCLSWAKQDCSYDGFINATRNCA
jgi:hypothetical protein